jgi:hypothetical protein
MKIRSPGCRCILGLLALSCSLLISAEPVPDQSEAVPVKKFQTKPTNSSWEHLDFDRSIYDNPYKMSLFNPQNGENGSRLWSQTKSMFGYGLGVAGFLALLPDDITNWETESARPLKKWGDNVSQIMVWDRDDWLINYVGHPYFGGVYYQAARKSGYRQWDSFLYSFMMSTFYWEYGLEAFAEVPALQDLVVTPVLGWVYGEWAFNKEQEILKRGGTALGSERMGSIALFFLDPVDSIGVGVNKLFGRQLLQAGTGYVTYGDVRMGDTADSPKQKQLLVGVQYTLDMSNEPIRYKRYNAITNDPVDTGIIGVSLGTGRIKLDDDWEFEDGTYPEWSLGLYFTRKFSARLHYGLASLDKRETGEIINYEVYGVDAQYYFNSDKDTRPYLTVGLGEQMFDKDRDQKNVIWNLGVGVHQKINSKWAVEGDWQQYYSPSKHTSEQSLNIRVVYRFGRGEHAGL